MPADHASIFVLLLASTSCALGGYPYRYNYNYPVYDHDKGSWQKWDGGCQGISCQQAPQYPQSNQCPDGYQRMADNTCGCPYGHGSYVYPSLTGYPSQAPHCYGWTGFYSNGHPYTYYSKYKYRKMGYQYGQDGCSCFACPTGYTSEGGPINQAACRPPDYYKKAIDSLIVVRCKGQPHQPQHAKSWKRGCKDGKSGRKCGVRCMPGYLAESRIIAACQPDGTWKVTGTCVAKQATSNCSGSPEVPANSNGWDTNCVDAVTGAQCTATCTDGYTGAPLARCTKTGWTVTGSCSQGGGQNATCPGTPRTADNANPFDSCTDGVEGTECSADCLATFTGSATATCLGGTWTVSSTCTNGSGGGSGTAICIALPPTTPAVAPWTSADGICQNAPLDEVCVGNCATGADGTYAEALCTATGVWSVDTDCTMNSTQTG